MKVIEIFLRHLLIELLVFLSRKKSNTQLPQLNKDSKILFLRLNRIGDALISTPVISIFKQRYNAEIHVLADRKNHFIFANNPDVSKVFIFEKGLAGFIRTLRKIEFERYLLLVDLHDDVSTTGSFIVAFSNAKYKVGLERKNYKIFSKTIKRPDPSKTHISYRLAEIPKLFNDDPVGLIGIKYFPNEISEKKAEEFLKKVEENNNKIIGINISAGSNARYWGTNNYIRLIKFLDGLNLSTFILASPGDKSVGEKIANTCNKYLSCDPFDLFAAIILRLDLLITPDTSAVHIASAGRVPVFGLYVHYNTEEVIWSPINSQFDYILTKEPTLANIKYEDVEKKIKEFIPKII